MANYALPTPNPRAYDPSSLEASFAQGLAGPYGNLLVGYMYGAQADRRAGGEQYNAMLDQTQRRAAVMAQAAQEAELEQHRMQLTGRALEHPEYALMFGPSRALIAPGMERPAAVALEAGVGRSVGRAREANADAAYTFAQAGAAPPDGTGYSLMGVPDAPLRQGTPLVLRQERMQQGGANYRAGLAAGNNDPDQQVRLRAEVHGRTVANQAVQTLARTMGISVLTTADGRIDVPMGRVPLTPQQRAMLEAERDTVFVRERDGFIARVRPQAALPQQQGGSGNAAPAPAPAPNAAASGSGPAAAAAPTAIPSNVVAMGQTLQTRERAAPNGVRYFPSRQQFEVTRADGTRAVFDINGNPVR